MNRVFALHRDRFSHTFGMYSGSEFKYVVTCEPEWAGSAPGSITCWYEDKPIGRFTFNLYESTRVVETHMLKNFAFDEADSNNRRSGLGMELFQQLMENFPGYEMRVSGDVSGMTESGQYFINAVREGNSADDRPPLPYHEHDCFKNVGNPCVCTLGGRQRGSAGGDMQ